MSSLIFTLLSASTHLKKNCVQRNTICQSQLIFVRYPTASVSVFHAISRLCMFVKQDGKREGGREGEKERERERVLASLP